MRLVLLLLLLLPVPLAAQWPARQPLEYEGVLDSLWHWDDSVRAPAIRRLNGFSVEQLRMLVTAMEAHQFYRHRVPGLLVNAGRRGIAMLVERVIRDTVPSTGSFGLMFADSTGAVLDALGPLFGHRDDHVRAFAIASIPALADRRLIIRHLAAGLQDSSSTVREAAADRMYYGDDYPELLEPIARAFESRSINTHALVLAAGRLGDRRCELVHAYSALLDGAGERFAPVAALRLLGTCRDVAALVVRRMIRSLRDTATAADAARALGQIGVESLSAGLADSVVRAAVAVIGLDAPDESEWRRFHRHDVVHQLAIMGLRGRNALISLTGSPDIELATTATRSLTHIAIDPIAGRRLMALLAHRNDSIRIAAISALGSTGDVYRGRLAVMSNGRERAADGARRAMNLADAARGAPVGGRCYRVAPTEWVGSGRPYPVALAFFRFTLVHRAEGEATRYLLEVVNREASWGSWSPRDSTQVSISAGDMFSGYSGTLTAGADNVAGTIRAYSDVIGPPEPTALLQASAVACSELPPQTHPPRGLW